MSQENNHKAEFTNPYWGRQIDAISHELSRLAIVCDIELGRPGLAERILKNDRSVCGREDPEVFQQIRQHLMALFTVEERAIEQLGPDETKDILNQVRASVIEIRKAGSTNQSLPIDEL